MPLLFMAAMVLLCARGAFALGPSLDVSQYAHTSWKIRDGSLRSSVFAITQSSDGYLWLGTEFGLVRFDGVRFVNWQPPAGQALPGGRIRGLLATNDGTLWIGTDEGLASWKDGRITQYAELAGQLVAGIFEDRAGTVWVGGVAVPSGKLCEIRGGKPRCYGDDGSLGTGIARLLQDGAGNLWAIGGKQLWRWDPGPPKMYALSDTSQGVAENEKGQLLISTISSGMSVLAGEKIESFVIPGASLQTKFGPLCRDHSGGMWIGTVDGGLFHVHNGRTDDFSQRDGLTGNWVRVLFEDREGNIWVATSDGLDRFREFSFPTISAKQGLTASSVSSVLAARDGSIWIGTYGGLNRMKDGRNAVFVHQRIPDGPEHQVIDAGLPANYIASLWEDAESRIWVSTRRGLALFENGRFAPIKPLPARDSGWVFSMAGRSGTDAWVSTFRAVFHVREQRTAEGVPWQVFGKQFPALSLVFDLAGGLYLGFEKGGLVYFKDGEVRTSYTEKDGLGRGHVFDLYADRDGAVWAAAQGGLSRVSSGHIATLTSRNGLPCDTVLWMREDGTGAAWLYMPCGLVRIARSDLDAWVTDPNKVIHSIVFDASDGIRTMATSTSAAPNVTIANDGKLWFTTLDGVSVIDPRHLPYNKVPPPVHIEQVTADGKVYDAANGVRLPRLVRYVDIDYTALSLSVPEKVRFRVKLEGEDRDWRELVNVRRVSYTNLGPKHYRFLVKACNNSGVWNEEGAALDFVIPPAWYQTYWFFAACVAAFLALFWALYQYRLHQLAQQFNMRLEERVGERTRIARDLHDTLLQSFHGILLFLQSGIHLMPEHPAEGMKTLKKAAEQAERAIIEGREAVQGLRSSTVERNDLALAIKTLGGELAAADSSSHRAEFNVQVEGIPRELHPILRDEVYRIAGEAMRNAFRHADAKQIEVEIRYDERQLRLRVRDDGKGIDPKLLSHDGREGHFGLRGMRERAKLIGGKLTVWSELDSGTEVELSLPANRAYTVPDGQRSWLAEKFAKLSGKDTELKS